MAVQAPAQLRRLRPSSRALRIILVSFLAVLAGGLAVLAAAWGRACAGNSCPSIAELGGYDPNQASKVYAADGRLITDLGLERRTVVPLGEMSPVVKAAFISTEDKRFYEHHGIDWYRFFGAVKSNVTQMRMAEGFSTITMQLARNLWPEDISGRDKSLRRKLREAKVAREIEAAYPKDKILELYLNQIDLGNRAYGVEAASQRYFGKSVRDLNVAEAATLAAIPKAPSTYNPAQESEPQHPAPQHGHQPAAGQRPAERGRGRAVEGLPTAALLPLRLQRRRRVLRRVRPPAARRQVRLPALPVGLPDLHHARSRYSAGRRAGAGGPPRGHRERSGRQVHLAQLPRLPGLQGGQPGQRPAHHHAVPAGAGGDAGRQDRADPRHGGRPRLQRQQVQPRHPGAAPAGLHLQADRLLRRDRGRVSAVSRDGGRLAQHDRRLARAALDPAELRSRVRRADDVAARRSICRGTPSPSSWAWSWGSRRW